MVVGLYLGKCVSVSEGFAFSRFCKDGGGGKYCGVGMDAAF